MRPKKNIVVNIDKQFIYFLDVGKNKWLQRSI